MSESEVPPDPTGDRAANETIAEVGPAPPSAVGDAIETPPIEPAVAPAPPVVAPHDRAPLGAALGQFFGFVLVEAVNALVLTVTIPVPKNGRWLRVAHHTYDLGYALALGFFSAAVVGSYVALRNRFAKGLSARATFVLDIGAVALASVSLGYFLLTDDLENLAGRVAEQHGWPEAPLLAVLVAVVAMGIPAIALVARLLSQAYLRWVSLGLGLLFACANHRVLTQDYPGAHLYLAWAGAILIGSALSTFNLRSAAPSLGARWISRANLALFAAYAAWSLVSIPRSKVRVEMLSVRGSMMTPFLARIQATAVASGRTAKITPEQAPWFVDRSLLPDVPPTASKSPTDPIVIVLTFDAMRADIVESKKYDASIGEMVKMRREGVHFTMARSPGSQTVYGLSTAFAGKYFSQLYWTSHGPSGTWPWQDNSVRFPTLLVATGIPTVTYASRYWLINEYGVIRGFSEEEVIDPETTRETPPEADDLTDPFIEKIQKHKGGPLFAFLHYMDSHAPYAATHSGTMHDRYLRALSNCDEQIGRIRKALDDAGLTDRTTLFVSADHGEAFGEHGATMHGTNLYEEQIRVPLLVVGPGVVAHSDATPISLIDLGPTVLDLFGKPTPASFLGQSLVPLLRGQKANLTRPIVAEGRLKQAMILPNGFKLIRNQRDGTQEIYDLKHDPRERENLIENKGPLGSDQMAVLEKFFDVHILRTPSGYKPPYRR